MSSPLNRSPLRRAIHSVAASPRVEAALTEQPQLQDIVERFTAGDHPAKAVVVALDRTSKGMDVTYGQAMVDARDEADAQRVVEDYQSVIQLSGAAGVRGADLSVGLEGLGLLLGSAGPAMATEHARALGRAAEEAGMSLTVSMGRPEQVEDTLAVVRELRAERPGVGFTLQSNLRRTLRDLDAVLAEASSAPQGQRLRLRLCKGAYRPTRSQGWDTAHQVDRAFVRELRAMMENPAVIPLMASHDSRMVSITHELVRRSQRSMDDYEFQMMMGIRPLEHRRLVDTGRRLRVFIPYGEQWYGYLAHQLTEQPQTLGRVLRQLVNRR